MLVDRPLFFHVIGCESNYILFGNLLDQPVFVVIILKGFLPSLDIEVEVGQAALLRLAD